MARTYAVVWRSDESPRRVGKLTIDGDGVRLDGGEPGVDAVNESFDAGQISSVGLTRSSGARLDGRPTVALTLVDGHEVRLASLVGPGAVHEIARRLAQLLPAKV